MKRYDLDMDYGHCALVERPDGEYVLYADHVEAMKRIAGDSAQPSESCDHDWIANKAYPLSDNASEVCSKCWVGRHEISVHCPDCGHPFGVAAPAPASPAALTVTDGMVYAFHGAIGDGAIGADEFEELRKGIQAALAAS